MLSFNTHTWKDRQTEHPTRRVLTDTLTQESNTFDVSKDEEGTVYQEGVQFNADTMNDFENRVVEAVARVQTRLNQRLDTLYPIGSIYIAERNVSPATIFGGTWESISGGVLLPSNSSGIVTGSDSVNLSFSSNFTYSGSAQGAYADCPDHAHSMRGITTKMVTAAGGIANIYGSSYHYINRDENTSYQEGYTSSDHDKQQTHTHDFSGSGNVSGTLTYNNMMPTLTVYAWKRTA